MPVLPGSTFLDTTDNPHLWVVVAGPDADGKVIFVSFTSVKGRDDRTTVCAAGEHLFIDKPTVVAYKYAMHVEVAEIEAQVASGQLIRREDCSVPLLKRVADGLLQSDSTPLGVTNAYVDILRAPKQ